MKHPVRLQTFGGWGYPSPAAFAFDLSGAAAWKLARKSGVKRYGRAPGSGEDDTRPIAPDFRLDFSLAWNRKSAWQNGGDAKTGKLLRDVAAPFGGAPGVSFTATQKNKPNHFAIAGALGAGEAVAIRALVLEVSGEGGETSGHVWHFRIGRAGAGAVFQIRDGKPEIARLSKGWTRGGENQLRALWALDEPSADDDEEMETLQKQLYSSFETLSLERSTGRDKWLGEAFEITLLPDPRGGLHLILSGGDALMIEPQEGGAAPWGEGAAMEVGGTGGGWVLQTLGVRFKPASMKYGPFIVPGEDTGALELSASAFSQKNGDGENFATVTLTKDEGDAFVDWAGNAFTPVSFNAKFSTDDARYGAWLYGLSARLENGPRTGLDEIEAKFDSDDLSTNAQAARDAKPIREVRLTCDEGGARSATVTMRDMSGAALSSVPNGIDGLNGHVCNLTKSAAPLFTQALIVRARLTNAARMAVAVPSGPRRMSIDVSKAGTGVELELSDGHQLLRETLCNPPIISDGKTLGAAVRQRLRLAGYSLEEMARVPADFGQTLPKAAAGEDWAMVTDENDDLESSINALLDRFGYKTRFYQDKNGIWVLENRPVNVVAAFTSDSSKNDPLLKRGGTRFLIKNGFDWERDNENFYNIFRVVGGEDGKEITRDYLDEHSMKLGAAGVHPRWVGRPKRYPTLRDSGLRTPGAVNYALRSLVDRYHEPGRSAQFETYFVRPFAPRDRVTLDGVLCEVLSWEASIAKDSMQIRVREVL